MYNVLYVCWVEYAAAVAIQYISIQTNRLETIIYHIWKVQVIELCYSADFLDAILTWHRLYCFLHVFNALDSNRVKCRYCFSAFNSRKLILFHFLVPTVRYCIYILNNVQSKLPERYSYLQWWYVRELCECFWVFLRFHYTREWPGHIWLE